MACGKIARNEYIVKNQPNISNHIIVPTKSNEIVNYSSCSCSCSQAAVQFLQNEHEQILKGLHDTIKELRNKYDGSQFELHLRDVSPSGISSYSQKIDNLNIILTKKNETIQKVQKEIERYEEEKHQMVWKNVQLKQQVEAGDRKNTNLKEQLLKCKEQLKELETYNSTLILSNKDMVGSLNRLPKDSDVPLDSVRSKDFVMSQESSEAYCSNSQQTKYSSRYSSSSKEITLPPIVQPISRPYIRKQLRLLSAPIIPVTNSLSKIRPPISHS